MVSIQDDNNYHDLFCGTNDPTDNCRDLVEEFNMKAYDADLAYWEYVETYVIPSDVITAFDLVSLAPGEEY